MGISAVMVHWLARLYKRGAFADARSVVELCPQDIMTTPAVVRSVFEHLFDAKVAQEVLNGVFDDGQPKRSQLKGCGMHASGWAWLASPPASARSPR
jgi:hypothetical protein